jgi:hypothetical protein
MVIKKLIAISVVFALVATAAFAADVSGVVIGSVDVAGSVKGADPELFAGNGLGRVRLEASGEAEVGIGSIGGWIRFDAANPYAVNIPNGAGDPAAMVSGIAWWQPIEQLRIQLGHSEDGHFDTTHIVRYGFQAQVNEIGGLGPRNMWSGVVGSDNTISSGSKRDVSLSITPMDGVSINIAFPWNAGPNVNGDKPIANTFKQIFFQANYNADFGAIHITYDGVNDANVMGNFFASAYLGSLVDGLGLEIGAKFGIKAENAAKPPLNIGLGVKYDVSEQFGVKLRSFFGIPMESGGKVAMSVDLLPYYAVNDSVTAFFNIGIVKGTDMTFFISPYVRVGSEWGASFYAGFYFTNDDAVDSGTKATKASWGIPIGLVASF